MSIEKPDIKENVFAHFILTRFNIDQGASSVLRNDPTWLRHRFSLFSQYCFPSVVAQSCQNFKWIILFDIDTPLFFKNKVARYFRWQNLIPLFIRGREIMTEVRKIILKNIEGNTKYLITTRLDNDDAIFRNYIFDIQKNFKCQEFHFLNFVNGYLLTKHGLYRNQDMSNPYISLIEKLDGFKTVWCGEHNKLSVMGPVKQIVCEPAWLTIIHGRNISNKVEGVLQPPAKLRDLYDRFAIKKLKPSIIYSSFYLLKQISELLQK